MTANDETWRQIAGAPGYEVSNLGRVRSVDRVITNRLGVTRLWRGRVLAPHVNGDGYEVVRLGAVRPRPVHQLVLEAFVGPRPAGMVGCHGPGGSLDNRSENLRWDTQGANIDDSVRAGTHHFARRVKCPWGHRLVWPNLRGKPAKPTYRACLACSRGRAANRGKPERLVRAAADDHYRRIMAGVTLSQGEVGRSGSIAS